MPSPSLTPLLQEVISTVIENHTDFIGDDQLHWTDRRWAERDVLEAMAAELDRGSPALTLTQYRCHLLIDVLIDQAGSVYAGEPEEPKLLTLVDGLNHVLLSVWEN
jgi:hypothetical protein